MSQMTEIRWHARGGQGAKTAATMLAASALKEGKYSQGYPDYGPERMGAPIRGFTRISETPIRVHCEIEHPGVVVVLDETLLDSIDVCAGILENGIVLVNTQDDIETVKAKLQADHVEVHTVDASSIALDEIKRDIPNTPMMGALLKIAPVLQLQTICDDIREKFGKKFKPSVLEGNIRAIKRAYEEVI